MPQPILSLTDNSVIIIEAGGSPTVIPDSDCNTPEKLLSWYLYLTPRHWVTKDILEEFVKVEIERHSMKVEEPLF